MDMQLCIMRSHGDQKDPLVGSYTAQAIERIHVSLLCAVGGAFRQDQ